MKSKQAGAKSRTEKNVLLSRSGPKLNADFSTNEVEDESREESARAMKQRFNNAKSRAESSEV